MAINEYLQALKQNWLKNDFTREFVDCDVGLRRCVYMMRNKFIALWEPISGVFKIWNRMTLEVEEVIIKMGYILNNNLSSFRYFRKEKEQKINCLYYFQQVFQGPQNHLELIFEVFEDALIYSTKHDIFIRNLTTQTVI